MTLHKYVGKLNFRVRGKEESAEVTIYLTARSEDAGGGWDATVDVKHRGATHLGGFFLAGAAISAKRLTDGLQDIIKTMPAPISSINVRRAGFQPQLVRG